MGSAKLLESSAADHADKTSDSASGMKNTGKTKSSVSGANKKETNNKKVKKRNSSDKGEPSGPLKRPKRAAACSDFKQKSMRLSEKNDVIESKKDQYAEEEVIAVHLTQGQEDGRPNRRLTDFVLHDANGTPQPLEMIELEDMFVSGIILPLEEMSDKEKERRVRCEGFGRIEGWSISGYEDGSPVIWLTTDIADYDCRKPASNYKKFYDHFFEKAHACVEVYKKLSKSSGGNPDLTLDELLAGVVRTMSGSKHFSGAASIKEFIISQGKFIYDQLVGLDETSKQNDHKFEELPALIALKDKSCVHGNLVMANATGSGGNLTINENSGGDSCTTQSNMSFSVAEEDEDAKLARLLQDEEYWQCTKKQKRRQGSASSANTIYIKINEDEIANDYPLPAFYKLSDEETDEYIAIDSEEQMMVDPDDLPKRMLHNWSLYNSDLRLISLELLPMKPCEDIDVTIFGSGKMTEDDGSGFCLDNDPDQTSAGGSRAQDDMGLPIFLSAIKEWMIELGPSMVFISIRTDMAWYRLGKPSKQYSSWYKPVIKTANVARSIITVLKKQTRVSKLSFADVIKEVAKLEKNDRGYISADPAAVERYVVVHGQIILQLFAEYPDAKIKKCAFVIGLANKMEERHHTKWTVNKKFFLQKAQPNLNPRAALGSMSVMSKRKVMQATTTRLINRIWGEYYSNYSPEDTNGETHCEIKEEDEVEEQEDNDDGAEEEKLFVSQKAQKPCSLVSRTKSYSKDEVHWDAGSVGKTDSGETTYKCAVVHGETISVGGAVLLEVDESDELLPIYFVEYMFETSDGNKMFHGRMMQRGSQTVLGNAANEREVFLTNECMDYDLVDVKRSVSVEVRKMLWGHHHRKDNASADKIDRAKAEERKRKGLPLEYYCKSMYWPEKGAFLSLPFDTMGLGSGYCNSCKIRKSEMEKDVFKVNSSRDGFVYMGIQYSVHDYVYVSPQEFTSDREAGTFKSGRNVGLKPYIVCQLLEITVSKESKHATARSTQVRVQRYFRPDDISPEKAYCSDIREIYYSEEKLVLSVEDIEGKCEVRKKIDIPTCNATAVFNHIFFRERLYDPSNGSLKQLPAHIKLRYKIATGESNAASRKRKGKCKEGEADLENVTAPYQAGCLATLDIFAG